MLQNTEHIEKGGSFLPKDEKKDKTIEKAKKQLGKEIASCRGNDRSQRNLAGAIGLSPSNMKYIEDGVNAPSFECYLKIIDSLKPPPKKRAKMDKLYTVIRKTPPPDVCNIINANQDIFNVLRMLDGHTITSEQLNEVQNLFSSFINKKPEGDNEDE